MSRIIGNPDDNAAAESFMETHKQEEVDGARRSQLRHGARVHRSLP
jgi:hypothetical protein